MAAINVDTKPWFRPPFGGIDDQIPAVVGSAGWSYVVLWDIDTIDWRPESDGGPTADEIAAKVVERAEGGSIVLMHLGGFNTLDALPGILGGLRAKGLRPVTLTEMFGRLAVRQVDEERRRPQLDRWCPGTRRASRPRAGPRRRR